MSAMLWHHKHLRVSCLNMGKYDIILPQHHSLFVCSNFPLCPLNTCLKSDNESESLDAAILPTHRTDSKMTCPNFPFHSFPERRRRRRRRKRKAKDERPIPAGSWTAFRVGPGSLDEVTVQHLLPLEQSTNSKNLK